MAYNLTYFGTVELPPLNPKHDMDTIAAKNSIVRTAGSAFDSSGSAQADLNLPQAIRYTGNIIDHDLAAWRTAVDTLRAMSRKRATLIRRAVEPPNEEHFCTARYIASTVQRSYQEPLIYETAIQFQQLTPWTGHDHRAWHLDDGHFLDSALYLDDAGYTFTLNTTPKDVTLNNGGNRATSNVRLTFTVAGSTMTLLQITGDGIGLQYSGSVAVGQTLVIDSGAQSVLNNGAAGYAAFALLGNHTIEDWLRLEPGDNTLTITRTGGANTTLLVEFADGWE